MTSFRRSRLNEFCSGPAFVRPQLRFPTLHARRADE